jgi:hypothetical protein
MKPSEQMVMVQQEARNSPLLYGLLVNQRGWPLDQYRTWIATALDALTAPG